MGSGRGTEFCNMLTEILPESVDSLSHFDRRDKSYSEAQDALDFTILRNPLEIRNQVSARFYPELARDLPKINLGRFFGCAQNKKESTVYLITQYP